MPFDFNHETLKMVSERFKTLAEPMRLELLHALKTGEKTVSQLVEETGAGQANVSKHLGLLHRHGWVERRKNGLNVYYRISVARASAGKPRIGCCAASGKASPPRATAASDQDTRLISAPLRLCGWGAGRVGKDGERVKTG